MEATKVYKRYSASINLPGNRFPLQGEINETNLLMLANNGTTPHTVTPELQAEADRIKAALLAGKTVTTKSAIITPV